MKYSVKRKIYINATLDSSEAIMFQKGGMHQFETTIDKILGNHDEDEDYFDNSEKITITFQIEGGAQSRTDWINQEAQKANDIREKEEIYKKNTTMMKML